MGLRGGLLPTQSTCFYPLVPARSRQGCRGSARPNCGGTRCEPHADCAGLALTAVSDHAAHSRYVLGRTSRAECCSGFPALDGRRIPETFSCPRTGGIAMKESMKRLTADQVKLGFIGLGNMGSRIARRLLDHEYKLLVYDRDPGRAEAVAAHGGEVAKSILELARTADVLLSCLTNDEAVRSVYTGPQGVFAGARPGTVVLEMSTISPESSRELHRIGARGGIDVLDVAISGSTTAAEGGILTLLAGGNPEFVRAAHPT